MYYGLQVLSNNTVEPFSLNEQSEGLEQNFMTLKLNVTY